MRPLAIALLTGALALGACAKSADEIPATYVSPLAYRDYSCDQLGAELSRASARAAEVAGLQDEAASDDETIMGVGLVLFWPALFFLEGDTGRETELARLRGEMDAVEAMGTRKNCAALIEEFERRRAAVEAERAKRAK